MGFHEIQFPIAVSKGTTGGPGYRQSILEGDSGGLVTIAVWGPRQRYDLGAGLRTQAEARLVREFLMGRSWGLNGFRLKDADDYTTAVDGTSAASATDVNIGTGDGSTTQFQLKKVYTSGSQTTTRLLRKPVAGTVLVALNGTPTGAFTVDTSSGLVSMTSAPTAGVQVTAGCQFDVPVKLAPEVGDGEFGVSIGGGDGRDLPRLPVIEMIVDVVVPEQPYRGGGSNQSFSTDTLYDFAWGLFVLLTPASTGLKIILPDITDLDDGGGVLYFYNDHASHSVLLVNRASGSTEVTLGPKVGADACVVTISGTKTWKFLKG